MTRSGCLGVLSVTALPTRSVQGAEPFDADAEQAASSSLALPSQLLSRSSKEALSSLSSSPLPQPQLPKSRPSFLGNGDLPQYIATKLSNPRPASAI